MKRIIFISVLLLISNIANAEWISSDAIGNDPMKEKLCRSRISKDAPIVPFEINSDYVDRMRKHFPDISFVVVQGQLCECSLRPETGRYERMGCTTASWIWRPIEPKIEKFKPGIETAEGRKIAFNICFEAYQSKSNKEGFDHYNMENIAVGEFHETYVPWSKGKKKTGRNFIAGKKVERYDVVVQGKAFYGPADPDLTAVHFACLLSPMFEVKALQYQW